MLIKFCQENAMVIANTLFQQHKRECLEREILRDRKKISSCLRTEAEERDSLQMGTKDLLEEWNWSKIELRHSCKNLHII